MAHKYKFFLASLTNENGLTLIEILAATFIFLVVVTPLSGIYLSGAKTYMKTEAQSNLRSELDFAIADIMKKTQDASYFDLVDTVDESQKQEFIDLFSNSKLGNLFVDEKTGQPNTDNLNTGLAVYRFRVEYTSNDPTNSENKQPTSTVTKDIYQFQPDINNLEKPFSYNHDKYLVYGLFQLDSSVDTSNSSNYQKLNVYLLIAPKSDNPLSEDGKPTSFRNLADIQKAIDDGNSPFEYIRVVKTQITVNNIRQG